MMPQIVPWWWLLVAYVAGSVMTMCAGFAWTWYRRERFFAQLRRHVPERKPDLPGGDEASVSAYHMRVMNGGKS